ncbi:unnamed protein product [Gordionus sp. m RMFG-2023]
MILLDNLLEPDPIFSFKKLLPKHVEIDMGKMPTLECQVNDKRAPVTWYFKGQPIDIDAKYGIAKDLMGRCTLKITDCRLEDAGEYVCKINDQTYTSTILNVLEPKYQFIRGLKSQKVNEKDLVAMECEVSDKDAHVIWFKGKNAIKEDDKRYVLEVAGKKRKLLIEKCALTDEDQYSCQTNADETDCHLTIEPANIFLKALKNLKGVTRQKLTLECQVKDPTEPVKWLKDGKLIKPGGRFQIETDKSTGTLKLNINDAELDDAGEYTVESGNIASSCRLEMQQGDIPPKLIAPTETIVGKVETPLDILIPYDGSPGKVTLMKDGKPLKRGDVDVKVTPQGIAIKFKKPRRDDTGTYQLEMINTAGSDTIPLNLQIIEKSGTPEGPLEVKDINEDRCTLSWKAPKDTGGTDIKNYVIEKQDVKSKAGWVQCGIAEACSFKVEGLEAKHQYKFRVKAMNSAGLSEPLVTVTPIIAKKPYDEPSKPNDLEVTDWGKDFAKLKWKAPASDGGAPITGYVVESRYKNQKDWKKMKDLKPDKLETTIDKLKEGDEMEFRITAVNDAGPSEPSNASNTIKLKDRFVSPKIDDIKMKDLVVKAGGTIDYDIPVSGEPAPENHWYVGKDDKDKVELKSGDRVTIKNTDKGTKLTIKSAQRGDTNPYLLICTNSSGTVKASANVLVVDKPQVPKGPLDASEISKNSVTLSWTKPDDDGGDPITYVVEKQDTKGGQQWVKCGETKSEKLKISDLENKTPYKFRVKAVNKYGESLPLTTAVPVLVKDPFDEPDKPGNVEVVDWDKNRMDIKWTPPKKDGGAPITDYVIEKKEKNDKDFAPVGTVPSSVNAFTIDGLKEGGNYQFRVRAVNKAGPGTPSEPTKPQEAKARNVKPRIDKRAIEKEIIVKVGEVVHFELPIKGEPPPEKIWTFKEKPIKSQDRLTIVNEDYKTIFTIKDAQRADMGTYTIVAKNDSGSDTAVANITVIGKPSKPKGPLEAKEIFSDRCKLSWEKPEDDGGTPITNYVIEKMDMKKRKWEKVGETAGQEPTFNVTGLNPGSEYKFRVKAINKEGESDLLEIDQPILAKDPWNPPSAPNNPVVTDVDKNAITVKWEPPESDGGAAIENYEVEFKPKGGSWTKGPKVSASRNEAEVPGLKEGTEYEFRVKALNKAGAGEPSKATLPVLAKSRPCPPKIDKSVIHDIVLKKGQKFELSIPVSGQPPPEKTWTLEKCPLESDSNLKIVNDDKSSKIAIKSADRKHTGSYHLSVKNPSGKDEATLNITVLTEPTPPNGPLEVTDIFADKCSLSWKKPEDDGGLPVDKYLVEKMDTDRPGTWLPVAEISGTACVVENLVAKKQYKFRVKAINSQGSSEPLTLETPIIAKNPWDEADPPGDPQVTDWDKNRIDIKWTPPKKDGGAPVTAYVIEKKEKGSPNWSKAMEVPADKCEASVPNLIEGTTYEFRVKAVNLAGPGSPSNASNPQIAKARFVAPKIDKSKLKDITLKAGQKLDINLPVSGEPPPEKTWFLKGKPIDKRDFTQNDTDTATNLQKKGVQRGDTGEYTLKVKNDTGEDEAAIHVTVLDVPSVPEGPLRISDVTKTSAKLSWNKPKDDGGCDIENYRIEKFDKSTGKWTLADETTDEGITVSNLTPNKIYKFRVKAVNSEGESAPLTNETEILARNPYDEPGKPTKPKIDNWDTDFVELSWNPPDNDGGNPIQSYIVEKKPKFSSFWEPALEVPSNETSAKVPNLTEGDEYQFRIKAVNDAGPSEPSDASDVVKAKPRFVAPKIDKRKIEDIKIKAGETLEIALPVTGEPPPEAKWTSNGQVIVPGVGTDIKTTEIAKLTKKNAQRGDSGKYVLTIKNSVGEDQAEINVIVLDKPSTPEGPLKISDITKSSCTLTWDEPEDNGGSDIQRYMIEKMDPEDGKWELAGDCKGTEFSVETLTPNHTYKFRVKAVNRQGQSEPLTSREAILAKNPFDEPDKPGQPQVTDWDKDHVDLEWSPPLNDGGSPITAFLIEKKDPLSGTWVKVKEVPPNQPKATIDNLLEGGEYSFRVKAVNKAGPSQPSDPSRAIIAKPRFLAPKLDKLALQDLKVKAGTPIEIKVPMQGEPPPDVEWKINDKVVVPKDRTSIENKPNFTFIIIGDSKRSDSGRFTLTLTNTSGTTSGSCNVTVIDKPSEPEGPLNVSKITKESAQLSWKPPADDGGCPVENYAIEKYDVSRDNWTHVADTQDTSFKVPKLIEGKKYKFRVKAVNSQGESKPLITEKEIIAKNPYDESSPPTNVEVVDYDKDRVVLKWDPPAKDGGAPIEKYIIEKKDNATGLWIPAIDISGDNTQATVPNLSENHEYQFRVKAVNKAGESKPSEATVPIIVKPKFLAPKIDRSAMQDIKVKAGQTFKLNVPFVGESAPTVVWTRESIPINKSDPRVSIDNTTKNTILNVENAKREDTGPYTLTLSNPTGTDTHTINVIVLDVPSPPKGPLQISDVTKDSATLNWKPPEDNGGADIDNYTVEKFDEKAGNWVPVSSFVDGTKFTVPKLIEGHNYKFRVMAENIYGLSKPLECTESIKAKNPYDKSQPPSQPIIEDQDFNNIAISWDKPRNDGGSPIKGYDVERKDCKTGRWVKVNPQLIKVYIYL